MDKQCTNTVLMVRPAAFKLNEQTAEDNKFQTHADIEDANGKAVLQFDNMVAVLKRYGINVVVIQDEAGDKTPDSIFPNNWFSTHSGKKMVLYPMYTANRRAERKVHIIDMLKERYGYEISDISHYEQSGKILEGTGSMVLDRRGKVAYACLSERTNEDVLNTFCKLMGYKPLVFNATDSEGTAIYHTNVMMMVGDTYAVVCTECVRDAREREILLASLRNASKEIIDISYNQLENFAGNMLQLENNAGTKYLVMSSAAYNALNEEQKTRLASYNELVHADISVIETLGGGSARCMMAEIF